MIKPDSKPIMNSFLSGCFFRIGEQEYTLHLRYDGPIPTVGRPWQREVYLYGIGLARSTDYVETGKLEWSPSNGPLTYREAQKALITYWQTRMQSLDETELDRIVEKCATWMHGYFLGDGDSDDYDIVSTFMDDNEWTVVLRPHYMANRLVEFYLENRKSDQVTVHSYIEDNELSVKF